MKILGIGVAAVAASAVVVFGVGTVMAGSVNSATPSASSSPSMAPTPEASPSPEGDVTTPSSEPSPIPDPPKTVLVEIKPKFDPNGSDVMDTSSGKVGVGVIPAIRFSENVPKDSRKVVVDNFTVTTADGAPVDGSWAWTSKSVIRFRPSDFWKGKTAYVVSVGQPDMTLSTSEQKKVVLTSPADGWKFKTARSLVGYIDAKKTRMNVYVDGKKVKSFPVSLGKPGWETRSGVKVLNGSKEKTKTYTSQSLGLTTETYRLTAPWNTRLTPSGEFIHAAPWAYGRIGRYNGSHGCTNMFANDAEWIFENTMPGDVFVYRGTKAHMESWNGPGGLWNVSDKAWGKGSTTVL